MKIYLSESGQTIGPYTEKEVFSRIRDGSIDDSTPATSDPDGEWMTLGEVLSSGFGHSDRRSDLAQAHQPKPTQKTTKIPQRGGSDFEHPTPKKSLSNDSTQKSPPPIPKRTISVDAIDLNGNMFWCLYHSIRLSEVSLSSGRIEFKDIASGTALNWFAGVAMTVVGAVIVAATLGDPNDYGAIIYMISMSAILCLGGIGGYAAASGYLRSVACRGGGADPRKRPRMSLPVESISKFLVDQEAKSFSFVVNDKVQYKFRYLDWDSFQPIRRELQSAGVVAQKA